MLTQVLQYLGGLSFEGGLSAFLLSLVTAVVAGIVRGYREARKKDDAVKRAYESSRPVAGRPVDEDQHTPLLTEGELARSLRSQLDENERLHSAEARNLRLRVRELEQELREERGKNASLTYATAKLRDEYRRSMGLNSEPPPAHPLSSSAITTPPPRPKR